jgi:hypothetical protein
MDIELLPYSEVSILFDANPLGHIIEASVVFGFIFDELETTYAFGFTQEVLEVTDSVISSNVVGIGYEELREYPFAYTSSGILFDFWENRTANWISKRPYPAWTYDEYYGGHIGPISAENISDILFIGDIIQFENVSIYYENGITTFEQSVISLGVNYSLDANEWNTEYLLSASNITDAFIDTNSILIPLGIEPLSLFFIGTVLFLVILPIGLLALKKLKKGNEIRNGSLTN